MTAAGEHLVRLAANARDIGLEDHGLLVDPVLVPRRERAAADPSAPTSSATCAWSPT